MRRRLFILSGKAVNIGDKPAQTGSNVDIPGHHLEVALLQLIKQETEYYCQRMIYSKLTHFLVLSGRAHIARGVMSEQRILILFAD